MTIEREDYRFTTSDKLYDAIIAAQVSAPTLVTDGYEVSASTKKGCRYVNFQGMLRNAADGAEGTTAIWLTPFFYFPDAPGNVKWFPQTSIKFHLQSEILADTTGTKGNGYQVTKPAGATRVAWATDASVATGNRLHLVVNRDT